MSKTISHLETLLLCITNVSWKYLKCNHLTLSKAVVTVWSEWIKHQINFLSKHEPHSGTFLYSVISSELLTCRSWHKGKLRALQELWSTGRSSNALSSYVWVQLGRLWSLCEILEALSLCVSAAVCFVVVFYVLSAWAHLMVSLQMRGKRQTASQVELHFLGLGQ